jgi:RimJ/RimL family protein N-acetyltransferase
MSMPVLEGTWVRLEYAGAENQEEIEELDQKRSQRPEMGGWFSRPAPVAPWATVVIRSKATGVPVGVIDATPLPGYPGVVNVSQFMDMRAARTGWAIDAYGLYITHLFDLGVRLVHHEVLEMNTPVHRMMRGAQLEASARLRDHGYAAGRLWDVLVYSYDHEHWQTVLARFRGRRLGRPHHPQPT